MRRVAVLTVLTGHDIAFFVLPDNIKTGVV
jgi:hypothetical protein